MALLNQVRGPAAFRAAAGRCRAAPAAPLRKGAPQPQRRHLLAPLCAHASVDEATVTSDDQAKLDLLNARFKMADVDGNGTIDREELRNLLESVESGETYLMSQHWIPEDDLDAVMAKYDTNGDGVISLEEFQRIIYDGILLEGQLQEYEQAFMAVDKSGNGTIGANELAELFSNLGHTMTLEKLTEVMQQYDKDESGQIEFREFLLMFRDKVLDLKAMKDYMTGALPGTGSVIDAVEGGLTLIFSEQELDEIIAQHPDKLVVVYAALTWCRPCKAMQRPVQKLAEHYKNDILFVKLFGNANKQTKSLFKDRLQVRSTPCFIALRHGEKVYSQTGANKERLEDGLRTCLPKPPKGWIYPPSAQAEPEPAAAAASK